MQLKVHSVHFDASTRLIDFVTGKVEKLDQYYDKIIGGEVFLKKENNSDLENKVAEIRLALPGGELFAKKQCKTFEEATDSAVDALRKQITKYKEKQRS